MNGHRNPNNGNAAVAAPAGVGNGGGRGVGEPVGMNMINNTVVMSQPGADGTGNRLLLIRKDLLRSRDWNSGICSCLNDLAGCALTSLCLPLALCRVSNKLGECGLVACCVPGAFPALRTKLRTMGGIRGSICGDCLMASCCCYCVACQMLREMDDMGL